MTPEQTITLLQNFVDTELAAINADERFHYKPALVEVNAPLALIQVGLKARYQVLSKVRAFLQKKE